VGITAMTIQVRRAYEIADGYRNAGKLVVLGRIHPSVRPSEALEHAHAVVVGEAELVWPRVLADALAGRLGGIYRADELADLGQVPAYRRDFQASRSVFSLVPVPLGASPRSLSQVDFPGPRSPSQVDSSRQLSETRADTSVCLSRAKSFLVAPI
jgi:radical SAM superfamily enzyme YgiQ (UPF0313 family)